MLPTLFKNFTIDDFSNLFYSQNNIPKTDIIENSDNYKLFIELPGLNKNDIKINLDNDILTIKTENKITNKDDYHYIERTQGNFERSFSLPKTINKDNIIANYKNGLLEIIIEKNKNITTQIKIN